MQASQILEIVIVTLIFSDVVPQLKLNAFHTVQYGNLSVALLHFVKSHCSVFKVLFPTSFEVRSQSLIS